MYEYYAYYGERRHSSPGGHYKQQLCNNIYIYIIILLYTWPPSLYIYIHNIGLVVCMYGNRVYLHIERVVSKYFVRETIYETRGYRRHNNTTITRDVIFFSAPPKWSTTSDIWGVLLYIIQRNIILSCRYNNNNNNNNNIISKTI
jgi:hypothetical protein